MYNGLTILPSFIANAPIEAVNPHDRAPGDPAPKGGTE
jgi:hypothetical protein